MSKDETIQYNLWLGKGFPLTPLELKAVVNNRLLLFDALADRLHGDTIKWEIAMLTPVDRTELTLGQCMMLYMGVPRTEVEQQ